MAQSEIRTKVTILTSSFRVKGYIELLPGARVTDYMREAREFMAVTDAEVWDLTLGGRQLMAVPFLNVSCRHIQVITPQH